METSQRLRSIEQPIEQPIEQWIESPADDGLPRGMVEQMIVVSRLNGERFGINAEHIERVEETPDTVLTLLDGKKYIVRESLTEVLDLVVAYRARILHISYAELPPAEADEVGLHLVRDPDEEPGLTEQASSVATDPSLETH